MIASLCTPIKFESNVVMYDGFVVENKTHFLIYIIVEKKKLSISSNYYIFNHDSEKKVKTNT